MKKQALTVLILLISTIVFAQTPAKYWIEFSDKKNSKFSVERPEEFLSPRAIELRNIHKIAIDERDLPVNKNYIDAVLALDSNARCFTTSKWLNGITVYAEREDMLDEVSKLPFVVFAERTIAMKEPEPPQEPEYQFAVNTSNPVFTYQNDILANKDFDYGKAETQVKLNNVHWLHRMGYRGENVQMMILDGGFENVDTISCFNNLRNDNRLLGARNLVQPEKDPMRKHTHGTMVLSCIASYLPGVLIGTAPMVQVYICQTEDSRSENPIEEDNWVAGLEYADSLGCQVLNSSLGYTTFDDTVYHREYQDLNGKTSRASRGAKIAAEKGMIICNSAGNEGGKKWKYIGAPADAEDILTVGAVNVQGKKAFFSSFGPTADGRIKPDACAVGRNTYLSTPKGLITVANGTSFSSPMLSGMVACLWQAFPLKSNYEIMEAVRKAGDRYPEDIVGLKNVNLPFDIDNGFGYGITNFLKAFNVLRGFNDDIIAFANKPFYNAENEIFFAIKNNIDKQNYKSLKVIAVPFNPSEDELHHYGKPIVLKVKRAILTDSEYSDNSVLIHTAKLPKLPKNKKYQLYEVDFQIDGRHSQVVIGQESPKEIK